MIPAAAVDLSKVVMSVDPSGITEAALVLDEAGAVTQAGIIRTARKLMEGRVFP